MSIIFGPIPSRRFGKSLGIDLSPNKKQCNFDCLYCELKPADVVSAYDDVVSVDLIMGELKKALEIHNDIDIITVTANGEPTLYPYLGELVDEIDKIKESKKTLILSNGSTVNDANIRYALSKFDSVKLSLDCATDKCLKKLDRPTKGINMSDITEGMLEFRKNFTKPLIIEILFVKNINDNIEEILKLNEFLLKLKPARIDISTIDRPPAYKVEALLYEEMMDISKLFDPSLPIYIAHRKKLEITKESYSDEEILKTLSSRPLSDDDIDALFDDKSKEIFQTLLKLGKIKIINHSGVDFYKSI
jgi:wyosine [tRNA(Phe)-imidazoG37] synthetase (radical SAM superfamily)